MEISEYEVVSVDGLDNINRAVFEMIEEGWTPFGGVCCTAIPVGNEGVGITYSQAMVKYYSE